MKKINALIVDDEKGVRELLILLIEKHCKNINIIGEAGDVDTAYNEIKNKKPELVFLDVQMPKGDGFSLLNKFSERTFDVIFTTSYGEYAIWAFKADAVDYILKPYDIIELQKAVKKVIDKRILLNYVKPKEDIYINVHNKDQVQSINAKDVVSLEAQNNYTLITKADGQKHLISKVLNDFEELLRSGKSFVRIHRSILINSSYIKTYSKISPFTITMINETKFEVSRRKRTEVLDILKQS